MGGHAAKVARDDIERNLGESVVTKENRLNYKYIEDSNKTLKKDNIKKISKSSRQNRTSKKNQT